MKTAPARSPSVRQIDDPTNPASGWIGYDVTVPTGRGYWSNTGCDSGAQVIDLSAPLESAGASPTELVDRLFADITLHGAWKDDGTLRPSSTCRPRARATRAHAGSSRASTSRSPSRTARATAPSSSTQPRPIVPGRQRLG